MHAHDWDFSCAVHDAEVLYFDALSWCVVVKYFSVTLRF